MRRSIVAMMCGLVVPVVLGGCVDSLRQSFPDRTRYALLDSAASDGVVVADGGMVLRIPRARVAPPFGSRQMQFRVGDGVYEPDYYNVWADDPGALITAGAVRVLGSSGRFGAVLDGGDVSGDVYTLDLYVDALYADATVSPTAAVARITATLIDPGGSIVRTERIEIGEPAGSSGAGAVVGAWDRGLSAGLAALAARMNGG